MQRKHAPIPLPELRARYEAGETMKQIAATCGHVSEPLVRRWLVEAGAALRTGHPPRKPLDIEKVRAWAAQGWTCRDMAKELGNVHEETVREAMIEHGIPRRPVGAGARPERNYFWTGGRVVDKHGYILVKANDHPNANCSGYVREHRLVMERVLGRYLEPQEVVDHIDGNTANNDPANLRLFASNADHLRATLKGKCPKWTEDGKRRIREGLQRAALLRAASRQASESDASRSQ